MYMVVDDSHVQQLLHFTPKHLRLIHEAAYRCGTTNRILCRLRHCRRKAIMMCCLRAAAAAVMTELSALGCSSASAVRAAQ